MTEQPAPSPALLPHVLLSAAMSLDGHIDDATAERLVLSTPEDLDRVDQLRAESDAILVGAGTLRADNPRLLVNSPERRAERTARGLPEYPLKVTLSGSGELDPDWRFWHTGGARVVYTPDTAVGTARRRLGALAEVVPTGPSLDPVTLLADLASRGVSRLMVEGGSTVHTLFLTSGLVDEIQLAVAPFFVGEAEAPRFTGPGAFPQSARRRMTLTGTQTLGDIAVLRYAVQPTGKVTAADLEWMRLAVDLSRQCPPSETAFSVGAVIVGADGRELARGYSREGGDPTVHAEEAALAKLPADDPRLRGATIYSTLEPCSRRASRPRPCAELIRAAGIPRVVMAWREPALFVADCVGAELLEAAGATVLETPQLAEEARAVNSHL
ncbi:dihydrofolate reductase family protein [Streptacidiphilus monticola]|uniref:Riboflavin biosynthesis protein RibD n=1 Tax=Streptacidiphilus monticola TaxID=2161674 RepID=A0ABW1FUA1_9ACTN